MYHPGKDLGPAVALSRLLLPEVPTAVAEPLYVLMLEHVHAEVISMSALSQATSQTRERCLRPSLSFTVFMTDLDTRLIAADARYQRCRNATRRTHGGRVHLPEAAAGSV
ncbi:hypothetical protein MRX96_034629 [Rhipicephalus microplus]